MTVESYEIAPSFSSEDFKQLDLSQFPHQDWDSVIKVFEARFESRFFAPLKTLSGGTNQIGNINGFIVLACAFLLVETLGGFKQGVTNHKGKSKDLFLAGLSGIEVENQNCKTSEMDCAQKKRLYSYGRCALLHSAGTEKIRVMTSGSMIKMTSDNGFEINRDKFLEWI